jgi:sugar O-acyltransferase (sialic acid O-acetyltransferase NeuD family)
MTQKLIIFGTGEIAELAKYYFDHDSDYQVVAFTVDDEYATTDSLLGLPIVPFSKLPETYSPDTVHMHVALSYNKLNQLRQAKYEQAKAAGYTLASYVCSKSTYWDDLIIGDNCFILENQTIQPTVKIGNNVMIWSGNHLGHASTIGDHTYIASHAVIAGHCTIGERCFLGINSTLKDFTMIGDDCFVSMDASVTKNMPSGAVAMNSSAEIYGPDDRRAKALRKMYFKI